MPWISKTNDVYKFPFHEFADVLEPAELADKLAYYRPQLYYTWMLPQLWAHFGRWRVPEPRWQVVCQQNLQDAWSIGLWRLVVLGNRSDLYPNQTKLPKYGSLTPFVLGAIREAQGVQYTQWDLQDPQFALLEPRLRDAVQTPAPQLDVNILLQLREQVLTYKTGPRVGTQKNAESTWTTGAMRGTAVEGSPPLQRVMLLQIWLAHPNVRHPLMILDPNNPDNFPEPLLTSEPLDVPLNLAPQKNVVPKLPWL